MSRLLYTLEDHFDALAEQRRGSMLGWVSRALRVTFALVGDVLQGGLLPRRF